MGKRQRALRSKGRDASLSALQAVIGAGASGLVAARELVAEGHHVKVFEAAHALGGIWAYDPQTESDPLGSDRRRSKVHSSMYASLRTNLPREVMSYLDLPFVPESMGGRSVDSRRFCTHEEVKNLILPLPPFSLSLPCPPAHFLPLVSPLLPPSVTCPVDGTVLLPPPSLISHFPCLVYFLPPFPPPFALP